MAGIENVLKNEEIIDAVSGYGEVSGMKPGSKFKCFLVLTPTRVIYYYKKPIVGHEYLDFHLDKIISIHLSASLMGSNVNIDTLETSVLVDTIPETEEVDKFVKNVKFYLDAYKRENSSVLKDNLDAVDRISKIAELKKEIMTRKCREMMKGIENLLENEEIVDAIAGRGKGKWLEGNAKFKGVLVLTSKRVIFYYKKLISGYGSEDFPLDMISSINFSTGFTGGSVKINTIANSFELDMIMGDEEIEEFVKSVKSYIARCKEESSLVSKENLDVADQISKFAELRDKGILTEEEFTVQKRKLLGM
ncbi:PH domain-containing protein [Methanosarcina barkeri]|nr:PH domain-containing protein [Methanosarcina barkeri]